MSENTIHNENAQTSREIKIDPLLVVLFFGLISFFGDLTYEAGRSITPSYLETIGLSAAMVGMVIGFAEAIGYISRLVTGKIADKTRTYWVFIITGYALLISVPLIGFTKSMTLLAVLIFIERIAKGIRSPSRDAVFSVLTKEMGPGKSFGIHEFLDQLGAILGPLIMLVVIYYTSSYQLAFLSLFAPYFLLLIVLFTVYLITRKPFHSLMKKHEQIMIDESEEQLTSKFWLYTFAVALNTIFLFPMSLILFLSTNLVLKWQIPLIAIIIQGVDAISAIFFGWAFDQKGVKILSIIFILSILPSVIVFNPTSMGFLLFSAVIFGMVFGAQESIYRAAIVKISSIRKRGTAYGYFNAVYGISIGIAGLLFGIFLDYNVPPLIVVSLVILSQLFAIQLLFKSIKNNE